MLLSILIPTLEVREPFLTQLLDEIHAQTTDLGLHSQIEVLKDNRPRGEASTGAKRNSLKERAIGKYIWCVDDDDMILANALKEIVKGISYNPDTFAINGIMTTDGKQEKRWEIAINNPYVAEIRKGEEVYLRYPNHITPMKAELVKDIHFPDKSNFEDKEYADKIKASGVLKVEYIIKTPVYHYQYTTINKQYV